MAKLDDAIAAYLKAVADATKSAQQFERDWKRCQP